MERRSEAAINTVCSSPVQLRILLQLTIHSWLLTGDKSTAMSINTSTRMTLCQLDVRRQPGRMSAAVMFPQVRAQIQISLADTHPCNEI
jgi:hypothetical protein